VGGRVGAVARREGGRARERPASRSLLPRPRARLAAPSPSPLAPPPASPPPPLPLSHAPAVAGVGREAAVPDPQRQQAARDVEPGLALQVEHLDGPPALPQLRREALVGAAEGGGVVRRVVAKAWGGWGGGGEGGGGRRGGPGAGAPRPRQAPFRCSSRTRPRRVAARGRTRQDDDGLGAGRRGGDAHRVLGVGEGSSTGRRLRLHRAAGGGQSDRSSPPAALTTLSRSKAMTPAGGAAAAAAAAPSGAARGGAAGRRAARGARRPAVAATARPAARGRPWIVPGAPQAPPAGGRTACIAGLGEGRGGLVGRAVIGALAPSKRLQRWRLARRAGFGRRAPASRGLALGKTRPHETPAAALPPPAARERAGP
jgi:hypothetical protein